MSTDETSGKALTPRGTVRALPLMAYAVFAYFMTSTIASSMNVAAGILEAERGWDSVLITTMISVASVVNVIFGFVAGRLCTKHSPKLLSYGWGIFYIAAVLLMGISKEFAIFAVAMCLANATASAWGYNTLPVIITNWFPKKKGTVQGIVSMGIPLGAGFASVIYTWGYRQFGVDAAFAPFVVVAGISLLLLSLWITDTPEERGLTPDTLESCEPHKPAFVQAAQEGEKSAFTFSPRLILLSIVMGTQLFYAGGLMVQLAPRLYEVGYTLDEAVAMMMISALFACVGSIVCGMIGDKFGSKVGVILTFVLGVVAIAFNLAGNGPFIFVSLALIGVVTGSADNWPVNICVEFFGREGFSHSFGLMLPIIQLVGALGPAFFAQISRIAGSYYYSYIAGAAVMVIGLIAFVLLTRSGSVEERDAAN